MVAADADDRTTLDAANNVRVDLSRIANGARAVQVLSGGLMGLYVMVKKQEEALPAAARGAFVSGDFALTPASCVRACTFDWYAISVVNLVSLVSLYATLERHRWSYFDVVNSEANQTVVKSERTAYMKKIPELDRVITWRNKAGAHRAGTHPIGGDTGTTMYVSLLGIVAVEAGRYTVGSLAMEWFDGKTGQEIAGDLKLPKWSLTENFEHLRDRHFTFLPRTEI